MKLLLLSLISIFSIFLFPYTVEAQSCVSGTAECCTLALSQRTPVGCKTSCPPDQPDCVLCTGSENVCQEWEPAQCYKLGDPSKSVCDPTSVCFPNNCGTYGFQGSCAKSGCGGGSSCPSGYQYCGGCINACRSNSQSCAQHIADECSSGSGGGSCGSGWCTSSATCAAANGTWGGSGSGGCNAAFNEGECCLACDTEGFYTQDGSCGEAAYGCGPCQRTKFKWSNVTNQACGTLCVSDPTCSTTSCTPACGQTTSCGGNCSDTDAGIPTNPTVSPANGSTVNINTDTDPITMTWTGATKADRYRIRIFPVDTSCASPYAECFATTSESYDWVPDPAGGNVWTLMVMPRNGVCSAYSGTIDGSWQTSTFTIYGRMRGNLYIDTNADAALSGTTCTDGTATATAVGNGGSVSGVGMFGAVTGDFVNSNQSWRVYTPWWPTSVGGALNSVTLNPGTNPSTGVAYTCTCPAGCTYTGLPSPVTGYDFFLTDVDLTNSGWWQIQNAHVYAGNTTGNVLLTKVPVDTCTVSATCEPFLIRRDDSDLEESAGVAVTGGGTVDTTDENGDQTGYVTDRSTQMYATGTTLGSATENYDYFYRLYSMGLSPADDFASSPDNAQKPTGAPANGRAYFRSGNLTVAEPWTVAAGESYVIFVSGNLTLSDTTNAAQLITVEEGGFLAFIVQGNITVAQNVGNRADLDDTTPNVEGVYIANGTFQVNSKGEASGGDERFVGAGTFVGWGGVTLSRDYSDGGNRKAENNTRPAEMFVYRPDLIINTPERMAQPRYVWQEVN